MIFSHLFDEILPPIWHVIILNLFIGKLTKTTVMKIYFQPLALLVAFTLFMVTGCDKQNPDPEYDPPTISITSPTIPTEGYATVAGETVGFTLSVTADAGLSTLSLGDETIKTFNGTDTIAQVEYDYLAMEAGTLTLTFTVEDAQGEKESVDALMVISEGEDLGYLLIDFAGDLSSTADKTIVDWDVRKLYTFSVSGSHGTSATAEVVNQQAQLSFAQTNPDPTKNTKVMKVLLQQADGFDNWGGWAHIIFGLGDVVAQDLISALPTWDNDNSRTVAGTKVIKLDAYYDATVNTDYTWDSLIALTDIWNADPAQGYKIDLALAAYDPMATTESGHDGAMYMGYSAYISEPNKWVTLTFDLADVGRTGNFYGVAESAPGPDVINCVKILPEPGYIATDSNPLYIKNLRIVDVE